MQNTYGIRIIELHIGYLLKYGRLLEEALCDTQCAHLIVRGGIESSEPQVICQNRPFVEVYTYSFVLAENRGCSQHL